MNEERWLQLRQCDGDFCGALRLLGPLNEPPRSMRKKLLFASECLRLANVLLTDSRSQSAIEVLARYAECQATQEELVAAAIEATVAAHGFYDDEQGRWQPALSPSNYAQQSPAWWCASEVAIMVKWASENRYRPQMSRCGIAVERAGIGSYSAVQLAQVALARDIFGNPFRPVMFSYEWRTNTAVLIARQIYESREFSALPVLADALQDAGCDSDDLLAHLRDEKATHVRGCWALDLVLGME